MPASLALALVAAPAAAAPEPSGLPLPRFVSLKAGEVNMRTGPGLQYPIEWVYRRQGLPVEITHEFGHWRKVRDWQGDEGWIHKSMLTGRRTAVVTGQSGALRAADAPDSAIVARLQPGVVARILTCPEAARACRIAVAGYQGWIGRDALWGLQPGETLD